MKKLIVNLPRREYPIFVDARLDQVGSYLKKQGFSDNCLIVTNTKVKKLYLARLSGSFRKAGFKVSRIVLPDGEQYKTLQTVNKVYIAALKAGLDRKSPIIALGGGVIGDITGFAAATYMRGIPFIQVPTTLLAMVDSSVGGKTGVDLKEGKNLIGSFYQPKLVWIDLDVLRTLPLNELRNGMAEVIKYGIIADKEFFKYLQRNIGKIYRLDKSTFEEIVYICCKIKACVVEEDECEQKGVREILNYGHTFGHAIETMGNYKGHSHGEAVAIGMHIAAYLAEAVKMINQQEMIQVRQLIGAMGLPFIPAKKYPVDKMISIMHKDKKARHGKLRLVLPTKIGKVIVRSDIPEPILKKTIKNIHN